MSSVEKRSNFLQVPNVFFETCALPESAQTLFLRLAAQLGKQHQAVFSGSIRKLANLVRMSKTTVNRMVDVLIDSELITVTLSEESGREVMAVEVNMDRLWELNTYHTTVAPVPIWDTILPDCPKLDRHAQERPTTMDQNGTRLSQNEPAPSQIEPVMVQNGPVLSQTQAQTQDNTNTEKTKKEERETPAPTSPAPAQSSLSPSSHENNSHQKKQVQVVHPLHSFLFLDDAIAPTTLTILLTSGRYESELEDDRRMRIAEEVQWDLEARGHIVQGVCVREHEQTVIEVPAASLFERLTDAQADFWRRWCALAHCGDDALTEKQLPDIEWLAERITTTADLESLYRSNAAMLLELSQAKGTQYTPPHLKNLIKYYPTWASAQETKQKQASQKTVSGTGAVKNWTMARLSGQLDAPPVFYPDVEPKKPASMTESMGIKKDLAAMFERMRG